MFVSVLFGLLCVIFVIYWLTRDLYRHIPGPSLWYLFWNNKHHYTKTHLLLTQLKGKYGPVFKMPQIANNPVVILSDFDTIYQVSVKEGNVFGGRPSSFRTDTIFDKTGIMFSYNPDDTWKSLRKTSQRHLRQFGDGLSRVEAITLDIAQDMFDVFSKNVGKPFNPKQIMFDTALNIIAVLIAGKHVVTGDPLVEQMREYEHTIFLTIPFEAKFSVKIFDIIPWVRHLGIGCWHLFTRVLELESRIWRDAERYSKDTPDAESIFKVFSEQLESGNAELSKKDAKKALLVLMVAGVTTTSSSFYALINILAHSKIVQEKIYNEIQGIIEKTGREPSLQDKSDMHYTRAVLLELSRYASIAPAGVPHRNVNETTINGLKIPANTQIILNQWDLHHDAKFWDKPYSFIPERFLDQSGKVVPPDHPNRKHLMPFGAGPRVCLGETLAQTRLFIWLIKTMQSFTVHPAAGNEPRTMDPRTYDFEGVFRPTPYEVVFTERL